MRPEDYYMSGLPVFYWFYPLFLFPSSLLSVIDQWFICAVLFASQEFWLKFFIFQLITVSLVSAVWTSGTWQTLWHVSVSNQTHLLRTAVCLPSARALTPVVPVDGPASEKKIWLLNKSTALIHCNYSNNNKKTPQVNRLKFSHLFVLPTPALTAGTPANVRFYILVLRAACRI